MNQFQFRSLLLIIAALTHCATAEPAVISMDLYQSGDGLLTYDTISHRQWLDLSQNYGQPIANVEQSLEPGGHLYGFLFATPADVFALAASAGYLGTDAYSPQDFAIANELNDLLGQDFTYVTDVDNRSPTSPYDKPMSTPDKWEQVVRFTNGLVRDDANVRVLNPFTISTVITGSYTGSQFFLESQVSGIGTGLDFGGSLTQATVGASWLYRDVTVAEPASALLLLLAACAIALVRCRATSRHRQVCFSAWS